MKSSSVDYKGILDLSSFLAIIHVKERARVTGDNKKTNKELDILLNNLTRKEYLELFGENEIRESEFDAEYLRGSAGHAAPDESEAAKRWKSYTGRGHFRVLVGYDSRKS